LEEYKKIAAMYIFADNTGYNQLTFASLKVIIFEAKFKNLTRL